jgi:hypothetical protein
MRVVEAEDNDIRGYAVDIRVFLVVITAAMAASFIAGVGLGPIEIKTFDMLVPDSSLLNLDHLTSEEKKQMMEEHLPSGQHLLVDIEGECCNRCVY